MEKTRNLSVAEYFHVIQKEYLIAEFRKKIYYNPKDKNYYQRVMNHKKKLLAGIILLVYSIVTERCRRFTLKFLIV